MSFLAILGTAAVVSAAIFMELIACLAFPVDSGTEWLLLLLLVPLVLAAIPLLLLRACAGDSLFSDTPKGRHWAEFGFAFFATGIIGVPSLLLLRGLIRWEAFALALGGLALPAITAALSRVCQRNDDDPFSYR